MLSNRIQADIIKYGDIAWFYISSKSSDWRTLLFCLSLQISSASSVSTFCLFQLMINQDIDITGKTIHMNPYR